MNRYAAKDEPQDAAKPCSSRRHLGMTKLGFNDNIHRSEDGPCHFLHGCLPEFSFPDSLFHELSEGIMELGVDRIKIDKGRPLRRSVIQGVDQPDDLDILVKQGEHPVAE